MLFKYVKEKDTTNKKNKIFTLENKHNLEIDKFRDGKQNRNNVFENLKKKKDRAG